MRTAPIVLMVAAAATAMAGLPAERYSECEGANDARLRACLERVLPPGPPTRGDIRDLAASLPDAPELLLEATSILLDDSDRAIGGKLRAQLLDLRGQSLLALGRAEAAADALTAALELDEGTTRVSRVSREGVAWSAAVDVGSGRLVRAARSRLDAGREDAAAPLLARAVELGERGWALDARLRLGDDWAETATVRLTSAPRLPDLPDFEIGLIGGRSFSLSDTRGHVVILDFWATWCAPCRRELPHLDRLYDESGEAGLVVIAVNVDEEPDVALEFADSLGLTVPIGFSNPAVTEAFGVAALPTVVVADRKGRVRGRWDQYVAGQEIEISELAERLLTENSRETVQIADVLKGDHALAVRWSRRSDREVSGVAALRGSSGGQLVATQPNSLAIFDRDGFVTREFVVPIAASEIRFAGRSGGDVDTLIGFRPGSTQLLQLELPDGTPRILEAPAPVFGAEWFRGAGDPNLFLATLDGLWRWADDGGSERVGSFGTLSGLARHTGRVGDRLVLLEAGKRLAIVNPDGTVHAETDLPDDSWTLAAVSGPPPVRAVGPAAVLATAVGRFLNVEGTQIALALGSEQLVLLESATGNEMYRVLWPGIVDVASGDLDGDGLDELIVADRGRLTVLSGKASTSD